MKQTSSKQISLPENESQSQSFDVSLYVKNNRKNRRKCKKIIHNCCVLVKKEDGTQQIVIKQFLVSCRFKTIKSLTKKAIEIQMSKDQSVTKQLGGEIKNSHFEKQAFKCLENQQLPTNTHLLQKAPIHFSQASQTFIPMPTIYYIMPQVFNFQII